MTTIFLIFRFTWMESLDFNLCILSIFMIKEGMLLIFVLRDVISYYSQTIVDRLQGKKLKIEDDSYVKKIC